MHKLAIAFVATSLLASCVKDSRYRPAILAGGTVLTTAGAALVYDSLDVHCQADDLLLLGAPCFARPLPEAMLGTVLASAGLTLLVATLLTKPTDEPEPRPKRLDERYATEARLAAGAGNCTAVRAILERMDPAPRAELEADPAIAACR